MKRRALIWVLGLGLIAFVVVLKIQFQKENTPQETLRSQQKGPEPSPSPTFAAMVPAPTPTMARPHHEPTYEPAGLAPCDPKPLLLQTLVGRWNMVEFERDGNSFGVHEFREMAGQESVQGSPYVEFRSDAKLSANFEPLAGFPGQWQMAETALSLKGPKGETDRLKYCFVGSLLLLEFSPKFKGLFKKL